MEWRFTIVDRNDISTIVEEPVGWADMEIKLSRDKDLHGVFFDFQTNTFQFTGSAFDLIKAEYDAYGVEGKMSLLIEYFCGRTFNFFYPGTLLFTKVEHLCGSDCSITISIEGSAAQIALKNRIEQSVDISATKAFDKVTDLVPYEKLGFPLVLPSKAILLKNEAFTTNENENPSYDIATDVDFNLFPFNSSVQNHGVVIPKFESQPLGEIKDFKPAFQFDYNSGAVNDAIEGLEIIVLNNPVLSIANNYNVSIRLKGNLQIKYSVAGFNGNFPNTGSVNIKLGIGLKYGPGKTEAFPAVMIEEFADTFSIGKYEHNIPFDFTWNGVITLSDTEKIWSYFTLDTENITSSQFGSINNLIISQTTDSYFKINSKNLAAPSISKGFMINEVASRVIESITNNQLKLYSEYYGRTDSQPYSFPGNGCGGLKVLLNGLFIRSAKLTDGSDPKIFLSLKEILDALSAIDNIGMGIEGSDKVRIENWKFFYQNNIMLVCDNVGEIKTTVKEEKHIATFKFGYEKWEAEQYNGLDEFLTKREYRTQLTQVNNLLEKICKWITSGYAYEVTRRQGPGSTDWRYDNDIFAICVNPDYTVEQGNLNNAVNIVDPPTILNFRISPLRNALKWFDTVIASYKHVTAGSKIIFSKADGNYIAEGDMVETDCKIEAGNIKENQDIDITVFADQADGLPIFDLETKTYEYPLTVEEFMAILKDPYGLIQFDCGAAPGAGWIDQMSYRPNDGLATFTLTPKRGWSA